MGRSPDHVGSFVTGLAMKPEWLEEGGQGFGQNLVNYQRFMRDNDIFATYTVLPPQGARNAVQYGQKEHRAPMLTVTDEDDKGITLNGMKMLGTSAVFADETWVGNLLPLAEGMEKQSITCGVPLGTPGVSMWSRKPLERFAVSEFDNPLAWRFDESDSVVIFEDVKIPWERVFIHEQVELSRVIYVRTPSHCMGNHQSNVRFSEKLKILVGLASLITEANGARQIPAVATELAKLAAGEAGLAGMIAGQIQDHETFDEYVFPNRRYMYAALAWTTQKHSEICDTIRELMGRPISR